MSESQLQAENTRCEVGQGLAFCSFLVPTFGWLDDVARLQLSSEAEPSRVEYSVVDKGERNISRSGN